MPCSIFRPRRAAPAVLALLAVLLAVLPAGAVIQKLLPLKDVLESEKYIFTATVQSVSPEKPGAVFKLETTLKGKAPFERLAVNLTGDDEAKKKGDRKMLLDRLAPGRKLVIFASKRGKRYNAMAFVEGTWFSLQGTVGEGKTIRWAFLHGEPYLRRTFAGTSAELKKIIEDGLAKKAEPPGVNGKEKPGYGPPVKKGEKQSAAGSPALFAVIPSFALIGPLAIIAALFPGVAARMAVGMKRWRAFLAVASVNSTLALVYWFLASQNWLPDTPLAGYKPFTALLLLTTGIGLLWAGRRYRRMASADPAITSLPGRGEIATLMGLVLLIALILVVSRLFGTAWSEALDLPLREFTLIGSSLLAATAYAAYRIASASADGAAPPVRLSLSGELVGLLALFLGSTVALCIGGSLPATTATAIATQAGDASDPFGPRLADARVFEIPGAHQVMSNGITIEGERLYFGAATPKLTGSYGYLFCINRDTGSVLWKFDNDEDLFPVFCKPAVHEGKVYVGEGLHTDKNCRLFCLDAASGKPAWPNPFQTSSHTEGNPRIDKGRLYFTAGDDGLFCADAKTGNKIWQFPGRDQQLHIDGPPALAGGRVFIGSGLYDLALLAVDAQSGKELWRTPVKLRSFGPPLVIGNRVVYGLGTGNMSADVFKYDEEKGKPEEPAAAGAVVCVEAESGKIAWQYDLPRSVHTSLAADAFSIYASCRDGAVYCLERKTGKLRWRTALGTTMTSGPAVAVQGGMPVAVYAATAEGLVACLNPQTGAVCWARDLREQTRKLVEEIYTTPAIVMESKGATGTGSRRSIYLGAMLKNPNNGAKTAAIFRFQDELGE